LSIYSKFENVVYIPLSSKNVVYIPLSSKNVVFIPLTVYYCMLYIDTLLSSKNVVYMQQLLYQLFYILTFAE